MALSLQDQFYEDLGVFGLSAWRPRGITMTVRTLRTVVAQTWGRGYSATNLPAACATQWRAPGVLENPAPGDGRCDTAESSPTITAATTGTARREYTYGISGGPWQLLRSARSAGACWNPLTIKGNAGGARRTGPGPACSG